MIDPRLTENRVALGASNPSAKRVLAAVVLYRRSAEQSQAFCSLRRLQEENGEWAQTIRLLLFDNSPAHQEAPPGFEESYFRTPDNPGLAQPYNAALTLAAQQGIPWLLLLDQDTTLTAEYIAELLEHIESLGGDPTVVAFAPKLVDAGEILSPRYPPRLKRGKVVSANAYGISHRELHVFNSGSVLRVASLQNIGGFSPWFPMEYLDHATFHTLQAREGKVFMMQACLEHELAGNLPGRDHDVLLAARIRRVLEAEIQFYRMCGTAYQRVGLRLHYLYNIGSAIKGRRFARSAMFLGLLWRI